MYKQDKCAIVQPGEAKTIVCSVTSKINRKERLLELIEKPTLLDDQQAHELFDFLTNRHSAFSLDDLR